MLKNVGLDANFCGVILRAKKQGDTAIHRTNKTRSARSHTSCFSHGARSAKRTAHACDSARHAHSLCSTPSGFCRPTSVVPRFWRFVGVYPPSLGVCCGWSVLQVVWLFRCHLQVLRSSRCVLFGRLLFVRCSFGHCSPAYSRGGDARGPPCQHQKLGLDCSLQDSGVVSQTGYQFSAV